ncbi:type II toxin-antitoxin system VapC family toxin [Mycobacterium shinjukuense]|uniref:type II toxin-antitoxin system VapC family toxin n=1 Tax=Mycobacterium shinjukuense TaxID=398694 RepID=UPI0009F27722|nr:type II toxin-antitoxin system VapC family toxin [Mycobacterium shinjukuense]MCV6985129.1 type II toxin-antitoxin system VapC family toxin [Mycobacterium shinjukuense]
MTYYYLDSSVAVRIVLGHSSSAAQWFDSTTGRDDDRVVSSRILRTEITRVLRRESLPVTVRDQVLDYVDTIPLDHAVLQEAEAIIPHIRTLDAIHLASALRSGLEDLAVVTHDTTMKSVAAAIGFRITDPVG